MRSLKAATSKTYGEVPPIESRRGMEDNGTNIALYKGHGCAVGVHDADVAQ